MGTSSWASAATACWAAALLGGRSHQERATKAHPLYRKRQDYYHCVYTDICCCQPNDCKKAKQQNRRDHRRKATNSRLCHQCDGDENNIADEEGDANLEESLLPGHRSIFRRRGKGGRLKVQDDRAAEAEEVERQIPTRLPAEPQTPPPQDVVEEFLDYPADVNPGAAISAKSRRYDIEETADAQGHHDGNRNQDELELGHVSNLAAQRLAAKLRVTG